MTPTPLTERLAELTKHWREDADLIESSCEIPVETAPWKPCEGCEWHAKGLRQAADALEPLVSGLDSLVVEAKREAKLEEHKRHCIIRLGSCARCIELGDEASIKLAAAAIRKAMEEK
jgi:hypothetical protein